MQQLSCHDVEQRKTANSASEIYAWVLLALCAVDNYFMEQQGYGRMKRHLPENNKSEKPWPVPKGRL